jgi:hypothetical protein
LAKFEKAALDNDDDEVDNTLTERRVYYALVKMVGDNFSREQALRMCLEVLPQGTLLDLTLCRPRSSWR